MTSTIFQQIKFNVLETLCQAAADSNHIIDVVNNCDDLTVAMPESQYSINHHVVALAGILNKTQAHGMVLQSGKIIIDVRRIS